MRDVLIGSVPPAAIGDWRYLIAALLAGLLIFLWFPRYLQSSRVQHLLIFDAAGRGLFAVIGTQKALGYGLNPIMAPLLGMLSGIGGGIVRDALVAEIPTVLRSDLYAVAALAGAVVVVIGDQLGIPAPVAAIVGAAFCFCLRVLAIHRGWQLPSARPEPDNHASREIGSFAGADCGPSTKDGRRVSCGHIVGASRVTVCTSPAMVARLRVLKRIDRGKKSSPHHRGQPESEDYRTVAERLQCGSATKCTRRSYAAGICPAAGRCPRPL